jgi:hypothetical protein
MKTGLILVDIQNDYFPGGSMELIGIREAVTKAKELLSIFPRESLADLSYPAYFRTGRCGLFST